MFTQSAPSSCRGQVHFRRQHPPPVTADETHFGPGVYIYSAGVPRLGALNPRPRDVTTRIQSWQRLRRTHKQKRDLKIGPFIDYCLVLSGEK